MHNTSGATRTTPNPVYRKKDYLNLNNDVKSAPRSARARTATDGEGPKPETDESSRSIGNRRVSLPPKVESGDKIIETQNPIFSLTKLSPRQQRSKPENTPPASESKNLRRKTPNSPRARELKERIVSDAKEARDQSLNALPKKPGLMQKAKSACRLDRPSQVREKASASPIGKKVPLNVSEMHRKGYVDSVVLRNGPALRLSEMISQSLNKQLEAAESLPTDNEYIKRAINEMGEKIYLTLFDQKSGETAKEDPEKMTMEMANEKFEVMIQEMHEQVALGDDVPVDRPIDIDQFIDTKCVDTMRFSAEEISYQRNKHLAIGWVVEHIKTIIDNIQQKFSPNLIEKILTILEEEIGTKSSIKQSL